jgi:GNAT superfamily N-acetyltransferase
MEFDPARSLRILHNERLRRAAQGSEYRDIGGALVVTSPSPLPDMNCIESIHTTPRSLPSALELGFALLRAFDCPPAVRVTPLDRPRGIEKTLRRRRLALAETSVAMAFAGDEAAIRIDPTVRVRVATPEDARVVRDVVAAGAEPWMRRMVLEATLACVVDPAHVFFIAYVGEEPAGTAHLLCDEGTAGIYAVATLKAQRGRGVNATIMARAIAEARARSCDLIVLRTPAGGPARAHFEHLGFEVAHEQQLWVGA